MVDVAGGEFAVEQAAAATALPPSTPATSSADSDAPNVHETNDGVDLATVSTRVVPSSAAAAAANEAADPEDDDDDGPGEFDCNVCYETAREPVVTMCGHLYCWGCLYR